MNFNNITFFFSNFLLFTSIT